MTGFNDRGEMLKQYATAGNLNSRALLHQLYSTNRTGWGSWVFGQYALRPGCSVLELGCGNGGIWAANREAIPADVRLVLSDFSPGMLKAARESTRDLGVVAYQVIDAQEIPYGDDAFDVVIANHMLYHVPDVDRALGEIARVLKPGGVFYATTIGEGNMLQMMDMLIEFDPAIDFGQAAITDAFGLQTGKGILERHFGAVEVRRYEDSLHVTDAQPLIDYVLSSEGIGNVCDIIRGERAAQFGEYVQGLLGKAGYIDIAKDAGMFIATRPR